ncbi:hydrolase [Microtetraspora sp. NBRC 13810]|uniref:glycerophosphodiester phosphodiesterase n=1 Tax=Microtetraspora sp. NBRC 13810 TaxID=3030990 RepID=UPI0024A2D427|nr:glycerophosphodiester phosphodiesterase family protein [Microtetraspora sp. NBRC 13810]GLW10593.1 hydrolase [Microtetraspora sp. NBRC 13810]
MFRRIGLITTALLTIAAAAPDAEAAPPPAVNVAHRGASAAAPENTVAAFETAAAHRADMFELDVQQTRDHRLIVMHDPTLARTTDVEEVFPGRAPWKVGDLTLAEIRRLDAGSWLGARHSGQRVPTLRETLRAMGGGPLGLLLEIKTPRLYPGIEARVAGELRRHPSWLIPGRLVVQSFNWDSMRVFHRLMPQIPVALLGAPAAERLPELAEFATQVHPPYAGVTRAYVRRAHAHGLAVYPWAVDDPRAMRRLLSYEVDGIITNRPDLLHTLQTTPEHADA